MKSVDPLERLKALVAAAGSQTKVAADLGISDPYLHDLLHGNRRFSDPILAKLGMERRIVRKRRTA